jgi:hypothetical protein
MAVTANDINPVLSSNAPPMPQSSIIVRKHSSGSLSAGFAIQVVFHDGPEPVAVMCPYPLDKKSPANRRPVFEAWKY